jgi:hypothetical protein
MQENGGEGTNRPEVKALFALYLVGIIAGIGYFVVIGLSHH